MDTLQNAANKLGIEDWKGWGQGLPYARVSSKDMHMEDAITISLAAMDVIEKGLAEFGIKLSPDDEDKVYIPMANFIEEKSNGNYRHEH